MRRISSSLWINRKKLISKTSRAKEVEDSLYWLSLLIVCVIAVVYAAGQILAKTVGLEGVTQCVIKRVTGFPCPGCGGTRAIVSLFHGKILTAIYYHAFAVYCVVVYLLFFVSQTLDRITGGKVRGMKFRVGYVRAAFALLIVQYLLKLFLPGYQI